MLDIFEVDGKLAMGANVNEKKLVQRPNLKKMFCISIISKAVHGNLMHFREK